MATDDGLNPTLWSLPGRRGFRLVLAGLLVALIYPQARLLWLCLVAFGYFWPAIDGLLRAWETGRVMDGLLLARARMPYVVPVLLLVAGVVALGVAGLVDLHLARLSFDAFRDGSVVSRLGVDPGRWYRGESWGLRGPIVVDVQVAGGALADVPGTPEVDGVRVVRHDDSVSVGRTGMLEMARRLRNASVAEPPQRLSEVDAVSGATYSSLGLREAVLDALWREKGARPLGAVGRAALWVTGQDPSRFVVSASAIIFIIGLLFEFCLAPFLRREAGITLPCYNCQTCVGVCPVKLVEGVPYPMQMVLEARLGNFARAAELGRYCVGCSRCASRCPAGISGALVGATARRMVLKDEEGGHGTR